MSFLSLHCPGHVCLTSHEIDDKSILVGEEWHIFDSRCDLVQIVAHFFPDLLRMCLYTLMPDYILNVARYSDRITLVITRDPIGTPKLIGFASINAEVFDLPMEVAAWDGKSKMTFKEITGSKGFHRANTKRDTPLVHISCIICDEPRGTPRAQGQASLGQRLLDFQKILAITMNFDSRLVALEAVKPLDTLFYARQKFFTTTKTFYPVIYKETVPMFHKLDLNALFLRFATSKSSTWYETLSKMDAPKLIKTMTRVATTYERPWPDMDPRQAIFEDAFTIYHLIYNFLWTKGLSDEQSMLRIRMFIRRAQFSEDQILRLWHMRRYTLSYDSTTREFKEDFLNAYPDLVAKQEWFRPSKLLFGSQETYTLRKLIAELPM